MADERAFTLTERELQHLLMGMSFSPALAAAVLDELASTAHSRHSTQEWLDGSAHRLIVNYRGFPWLSGGAGDGNRTRIASLEGSDAAKG